MNNQPPNIDFLLRLKPIILIAMFLFVIYLILNSIYVDGKKQSNIEVIYQRDELAELLRDKSPDQVIGIIGRPDRSSGGGYSYYWYYSNPPTWDIPANKRDSSMMIYFIQDKVDSLAF